MSKPRAETARGGARGGSRGGARGGGRDGGGRDGGRGVRGPREVRPVKFVGPAVLLLAVAAGLAVRYAGSRPELLLIHAGGAPLYVEVADTPAERNVGLSGRRRLPENRGMLFLFHAPLPADRASFWMKDTHVPLSIAFIGESGRIFQIEDMTPLDLSPVCPTGPVYAALEVNAAWFAEHGVGVGDVVDWSDR